MPVLVQAELERAKQTVDGIPIALDPLLQSLRAPEQAEIKQVVESESQDKVIPVCWGTDDWPQEVKLLEQNDGIYYFQCNWSSNPRFLRLPMKSLQEMVLKASPKLK